MRGPGWIVVAAGLASCGGGGGSSSGGAPFGLTEREEVSGLTFPEDPLAPGSFDVVDAFPALSFDLPIFLGAPPDGSDRIVVAELGGRILVFPNDAGAASASVLLDLEARVFRTGEGGLLGVAFDPGFATNGLLYVNYSAPPVTSGTSHRTLVSRFTMTSDPDVADPTSEVVLLDFDQPFWNHNGGALAFGPDGMLYVASGDGGSHDDPAGNGQDLGSLLGKILRIAPDGSVPLDNPFVGVPGARGEIWAYGLRNPWRMSFDRASGALWCGDVGQNTLEEIDLVVRGGNYGWDLFEGTDEHENPAGVALADTVAPVHEYPRNQGTSVTGGYVYRGSALPALVGAYVFADYNSGRVWALRHDGQGLVSHARIATLGNPASFGEDEGGELYACSFDGRIYRFEEPPGMQAPGWPATLSETGLFADTAGLVPTAGLIEYEPAVELWSDGARKRRWIALPGNERIAFDPSEPWEFPAGSVLVKHFEIELADGATQRLETRVLLRTSASWAAATYRWNPEQTEAHVLSAAESEVLSVPDPQGGARPLTWTYPAPEDCSACHTLAAGRVLGVTTAQLNRDFDYAGVTDNQLRAWDHVRLFTTSLGAPAGYERLPALDDPAASLAERAGAYLAANCAQCHRPGGPTPVPLDLRWGALASTVGAVPQAGDLGLPGAAIVAPGSKESSVLWERMRRLDLERMPPLGSQLVDDEALALVGAWIDAGAP